MTSGDEITQAIDAALTILNFGNADGQTSVQLVRHNLMIKTGFTVSADDAIDRLQFTGETPGEVIAQAKAGDRVAHYALCAVAESLGRRGEPLPDGLNRYILNAAKSGRPSFKQGRTRYGNNTRNHLICWAVTRVTEMTGFDPTRNEATDSESGCSIVAEATKKAKFRSLAEGTINEIWKHRNRAHFDSC